MDYEEALEYLNKTIVFGIKPGLSRIKSLLDEVGNPQNFYPVIQITGTNGKTSTARLISATLTAHGLKVGTYTSPHLRSYTERLTISGKPISEKDFSSLLTEIVPLIERVSLTQKEPLTHFEILTALAFLYFQRKKVEAAVVEVGMGGRWDATSVVIPKVAVITNVALEHTDRLGKTLKKIAWDKAHIIKEGPFALSGYLEKSALKVVEERCRQKKVNLKILGKDFSFIESRSAKKGFKKSFEIKGLFKNYKDLKLFLFGNCLMENSSLALATAETFLNKPLNSFRVKEVFSKISFPGRFEVIPYSLGKAVRRTSPRTSQLRLKNNSFLVVLDGAHNPAGAKALAQTLKTRFSWGRLFLILSIFKDKDIWGILRELLPLATFTILTENSSNRRAPAKFLSQKVRKITFSYLEEPSLERALDLLLKKARAGDLILVTGSLYTVAEAREYLVSQRKILRDGEFFEEC